MAIQGIGSGLLMDQLAGMERTVAKRMPLAGSAGNVAEGMGKALESAIRNLDGSQKAADTGISQLVAGEPVDLHQVMLQMEESMVKLNLALQVRNKVIEAYQEIQRMQI
ncbi:MAG: flagellar hook-basal body complex protein FliE [Caldilineaceae bacterium]|nr:flagellar hook-basal body complex protein FliE [Caldilineaceae bacterium]